MKNISFDIIIEINKGSRNKYEFDKEKNKIRLDRVLHSSMVYPRDYGYIPETLALDGDPLDVLVFCTEPLLPGCLVEVKPIGVFFMSDDKGEDEKLICVPLSDPNYNSKNNIFDVDLHAKKEIEHFFRVYKDLENKKVHIPENCWGDAKEAQRLYQECIKRFK